MNYLKNFLLRFKNKKYVAALIIMLISIILLSFNSTVNITFNFSSSTIGGGKMIIPF